MSDDGSVSDDVPKPGKSLIAEYKLALADIPEDNDETEREGMVYIPPFPVSDDEEDEEARVREAVAMPRPREIGPSAIATFSARKDVFASKGWDALFQAAQDQAKMAREGKLQVLDDDEAEAIDRAKQMETLATMGRQKGNAVSKMKEATFDELYKLLDETPQEAAERLKRMKQRKKTLLSVRKNDEKKWMNAHGRVVRPKLTLAMKLQLREAFDLIDQDGSGAIDIDELEEAFTVLGMDVSRREVEEMMDAVDEDGSGEVELSEFEQIMTSHLLGDSDGGGGGKKEPSGKMPFHIMATNYRRKRLLDAIVSGDKDATTSMIEKAENYRALEAETRARMIGQSIWISIQVAHRIKRFIRMWKAKREARLMQEARERARQKRLEQSEALAPVRTLSRRASVDSVADESPKGRSPGTRGPSRRSSQDGLRSRRNSTDGTKKRPAVNHLNSPKHESKWEGLYGERDMGMRIQNREITDRTMEKIRVKAKMASIVTALDAQEHLEKHSVWQQNAPIDSDQKQDLIRMRDRLQDAIGLKSGVAVHRGAAGDNMNTQKRMLLAATVHSKLQAFSSVRGPAQQEAVTAIKMQPSEILDSLDLTPRHVMARNEQVVRHLSRKKSDVIKRPPATSPSEKSISRDVITMHSLHKESQMSLMGSSMDGGQVDMFNSLPPVSRDDLPPRASSCMPSIGSHHPGHAHGGRGSRGSSRASNGQKGVLLRSLGTMPQDKSVTQQLRQMGLSPESNRRNKSKSNQMRRRSHRASTLSNCSRDRSPTDPVRFVPLREMKGNQRVEFRASTQPAGATRGQEPAAAPMYRPSTDASSRTGAYRALNEYTLSASGRNAPSPVPSSIFGKVPGPVNSPPEIQGSFLAVKPSAPKGIASRKGGSPAPDYWRRRSPSPFREHSMLDLPEVKRHYGGAPNSSAYNALLDDPRERSTSPLAVRMSAAIYPTYTPTRYDRHSIRSISPGPARHFVAVMTQPPPRTPESQMPRYLSRSLNVENSFPYEPVGQ